MFTYTKPKCKKTYIYIQNYRVAGQIVCTCQPTLLGLTTPMTHKTTGLSMKMKTQEKEFHCHQFTQKLLSSQDLILSSIQQEDLMAYGEMKVSDGYAFP